MPSQKKLFLSGLFKSKTSYIVKPLSFMLVLLVLIGTFILYRAPETVRGCIYSVFREIVRAQTLLRVQGWQHLEDESFIIYFKDYEAGAHLVHETAALYWQRICDELDFQPKQRILIVVYPSREALNASFGWPASENAMGAYWGGVIRVSAPQAWIIHENLDTLHDIFQQSGPMAHELTHLVLDYLTRGNYPRWFTEGIAQYEEHKITGYLLAQGETVFTGELYPLEAMNHDFDALPDQTLAYRQSLSLVEYIEACGDENSLAVLIDQLAQGKSFNDAMLTACGMDLENFEAQWRSFMEEVS